VKRYCPSGKYRLKVLRSYQCPSNQTVRILKTDKVLGVVAHTYNLRISKKREDREFKDSLSYKVKPCLKLQRWRIKLSGRTLA
jgi:hypothetical protein